MTSSSGPRRVVVLVRPERVAEGLRTAAALPLADNEVQVLLLGAELPDTPEVALGLDNLELSDIPLFGCFADPRIATATPEEFVRRLGECDHVLTF